VQREEFGENRDKNTQKTVTYLVFLRQHVKMRSQSPRMIEFVGNTLNGAGVRTIELNY